MDSISSMRADMEVVKRKAEVDMMYAQAHMYELSWEIEHHFERVDGKLFERCKG